MIKHTPVNSSSIKSIGYDDGKQELHVRFHKMPGTYIYQDVPPEKHQDLMNADSHGNHLHEHIKSAHGHRKA